ncbi:DUF805 domain-containing protein [Sulfurimonas sp.]|uniref:DUF805 domain-containing protein n=1 Tax=Sulfurimonas sp. TaxID=2022749 RepID=UPI002B46E3BB|nr:DUF805 domain-containing protein [Sulfurimonas sp.]
MEKESNNIISKCESSVLSLKGCYNRIQWWQTTIMIWFIIAMLFNSYNILHYEVNHPKKVIVEKISTQQTSNFMYLQENMPSELDLTSLIKQGNPIQHIQGVLLFITLMLMSWISITSSVKRLHDIDKSGFWWYVNFIPIVGSIIVFVMNVFIPSKNTRYCQYKIKEDKTQWLFTLAGILLLIPILINIIDITDRYGTWYVQASLWTQYYMKDYIFFILLLLLMALSLNFDKFINISYSKKMKVIQYISFAYVAWLFYNISHLFFNFESNSIMSYFIYYFSLFLEYGIQFSALCILILNTNKELKKVQNQKVS